MLHRRSRQDPLQPFVLACAGGRTAGSLLPGTPTEAALVQHAVIRRAGIDEAGRRVTAIQAGFPPPPARVARGALAWSGRTRPRWRHRQPQRRLLAQAVGAPTVQEVAGEGSARAEGDLTCQPSQP